MAEPANDAQVRIRFPSPMAAYLGVRDLRGAGYLAELGTTDDAGRTIVTVRCRKSAVEGVIGLVGRYPSTRVEVW